MTEFMHENVVCESVVGGYGAIEIENAAATIGAVVCKYLDEFVRRKLRDLPQRVVVKSEYIALGTKSIVGRTQRGIVIDTC